MLYICIVMGLEKAIEHGKEHRKHYRGSKRFANSCRNHQGCPWCEGNRLHKIKVKEQSINDRLKEDLE